MAGPDSNLVWEHGRVAVVGAADVELWRFVEQIALMILDPPEIAYLSPDHPNLLAWEGLRPPPELSPPSNLLLDLYTVPADPFYEATLEFILQRADRVLFLAGGDRARRKSTTESAAYLMSAQSRLRRRDLLPPAALYVDRGTDPDAPTLKINELPFPGTPSFFGDLSAGENCFSAFLAAIRDLIPEFREPIAAPTFPSQRPTAPRTIAAIGAGPVQFAPGSTRALDPAEAQIADLMDHADDLLAGNEINDSLRQSLRVDLERQDEVSHLSQTARPAAAKKPDGPEGALHEIGEVLYDYTIEKIMHGGLAFVFIAHNPRKKPAHIAIKTFRGNITQALERDTFLAEVQRTIALDPHPNLVKSFWGDVRNGRPYLLMEYVEGGSVRSMLLQNREGLHPLQALEIALETCNGLAFLWESAQLVHADLKPENILMDRRTGAKVTDLGLAANVSITQGGLGTPPYMAPEQWVGDQVDTRTDIYAFGVFLFEILTARWPFLLPDEPKREDFEDAHCFNPPVTLAEYFPNLGRELSDIIDHCLRKRPEDRFQDFREVMDELQKIHHGMTGHKHPLHGPGRAGAVEFLARAAVELRAGRLESALDNASKSIQAEPRRSEAFVMRGVVFQELGRPERAFDDYRRALDLDPYSSRAWFNLGLAHEDAAQWGQAEACFRRVSEIDPADAAAWIRRAAAAEALGELQESFACLTNAWEADAADPDLAMNLAQLQLRLGRPARTVEWLMELEEQELKDPRAALYMGRAEMMMSLTLQAENSFQRALLQDPEQPEVWLWRALLFQSQNRREEAARALEEARQRDPAAVAAHARAAADLADWWTAEARRLAQGGELTEAADRIAAAHAIAPENQRVLEWTALLFHALGAAEVENTALARLARGAAQDRTADPDDQVGSDHKTDPSPAAQRRGELIEQLEARAHEAAENRQFGRARALYTAVLNLAPDREECQFALWQCLLCMGEIPAAADVERSLLDRRPERLWRMQSIRDAEAARLVRMGEELVKTGMDGLAREQFLRALLLQGGNPVARFWLAVFEGDGSDRVTLPIPYQAQAAALAPMLQQTAARWREALTMAVHAQQWDNARLFAERLLRLGQATLQDEEWHRNALAMLHPPSSATGLPAVAGEDPDDPEEPTSRGDTSGVIL
ncbi:MAG: protein kinase domain-containing protein [Planctomycetota bacterium]